MPFHRGRFCCFVLCLVVITVALPKVHRLKQRNSFAAVYRSGRRFTSPHLTLRVLPLRPKVSNQGKAIPPVNLPTQIGITVSQKVSKRSVKRNRIRRQLRGVFQLLLPDLAPGWMLVLVVHPSAIKCEYEEFLQELKQLLIDAEVLNGHSGRCVL
ncbi:ribonuclease P protein component [Leptolyngbya sp. AN02str]|uniref:ribonuclease P protein component n=1 Tax=Leptolyngbya sp. AN02str TaxID=3423363 RepID=UPI003D3188C7